MMMAPKDRPGAHPVRKSLATEFEGCSVKLQTFAPPLALGQPLLQRPSACLTFFEMWEANKGLPISRKSLLNSPLSLMPASFQTNVLEKTAKHRNIEMTSHGQESASTKPQVSFECRRFQPKFPRRGLPSPLLIKSSCASSTLTLCAFLSTDEVRKGVYPTATTMGRSPCEKAKGRLGLLPSLDKASTAISANSSRNLSKNYPGG